MLPELIRFSISVDGNIGVNPTNLSQNGCRDKNLPPDTFRNFSFLNLSLIITFFIIPDIFPLKRRECGFASTLFDF